MYATIPSQNAVAIINTDTLALEGTYFVGSGPTNIALSPDGLTAYIANSTSDFVVVFDTQARTVTNSLFIPQQPQDVVLGNNNRLFVLGSDSIFQIDATSGASAGPAITGGAVSIYAGALEISPDRNTLYYGNYGVSPSTLYKFRVTTSTPELLLQTPFGEAGSNGQDLTLSHSGAFISYACGYGQGGYQIAKFRTSDFATLGTFYTDAYPREIAFSPDDLVAYTVHTSGEIDVFDTNSYLSLGPIMAPDEATELAVDATGRYLFASYEDPYGGGYPGIRVFDTGRMAQSPALTRADFNQDGLSDLVWQNNSTGQRTVWFMNGTTKLGERALPAVATAWQIAGAGDFNGDGRSDLIWQNATSGQRTVWFMNGTTKVGETHLQTIPTQWQIVGTGEFNGDGKLDIIWQNTSTGQRTIWFMNGTTKLGERYLPTVATQWQIVGTDDFNGDGQTDIVWQNSSTGQRNIWFMNGTTRMGQSFFATVPTEWKIAGTADFNSDGQFDLVWQNTNTGQRTIWLMNGASKAGERYLPTISTAWDIRNH
jgi:YVTN family beta-propeller protein